MDWFNLLVFPLLAYLIVAEWRDWLERKKDKKQEILLEATNKLSQQVGHATLGLMDLMRSNMSQTDKDKIKQVIEPVERKENDLLPARRAMEG